MDDRKRRLLITIGMMMVMFLVVMYMQNNNSKVEKDKRGPAGILAEAKLYQQQERWQAIRHDCLPALYRDFPDSNEAKEVALMLVSTLIADAESPTVWNGKMGDQAGQRDITDDDKIHRYSEAVKALKDFHRRYPESAQWLENGDRLMDEIITKHNDIAKTKKGYAIFGMHLPNEYRILDAMVAFTGRISWFSYAFAMLLLAVIVRGILWPLSNIQYKSMRDMQRIQPLIRKLQETYKGQELNDRMMKLYQQQGINPASGCIPFLTLFLQIPFLIWIYHAIRMYSFEFTKGTFLWIGTPLSHKYPAILAPSLGEQDIPLLIIYSISMYVTQRMMVTDPSQADQQKQTALLMSGIFLIMMYQWALPSAFLLYWFFLNILQTAQQMAFYKANPLPKDDVSNIVYEEPKSKSNGEMTPNGHNAKEQGALTAGSAKPKPKGYPKKKKH